MAIALLRLCYFSRLWVSRSEAGIWGRDPHGKHMGAGMFREWPRKLRDSACPEQEGLWARQAGRG